jgi:transposase-like protein
MKKNEEELINILCPACANTIVAKYKGEIVTGKLQHKCRVCKRYWDLNYTTKTITWKGGKADKTPITKFKLDMATGKWQPINSENVEKALLRREGA